jgi:hypothetical protein
MSEAASAHEFERGHTDPSLSIEWVLGDLWLPVVPVGWTGVLIKIVRVLCGLFLSFKVGDCEPSAVLECGVLYADEFPAFFAPAVEVVLNVFDYWFGATDYVV